MADDELEIRHPEPPADGEPVDPALLDTLLVRPRDARGEAPQTPFPESTRYRLGQRIGQGGMAFVYEAYDTNLDRSVAVKSLRPEMAEDRTVRERFIYEAMLLGAMDHPGMVPIFEIGELDGAGLFYSMKRIQGRTLRQMLDSRPTKRFDRCEVAGLLSIFGKVCQTVAYAHSRGIVHRDIKPENVMVDEYGVVLVLDWGLSKKIDEREISQGITATQTGIIKGTPAYMSPEQAEGRTHEIDFRTDVFSLGIILYEILCGHLPFPGKTRTEVLLQIAEHQPPSPRRRRRSASPVLSAICMKALQKAPERRYSTARELSEDLERFSRSQETSAYRRKFWERLFAWAGRRPAAATALAIFMSLALFGSLGAIANHQYRREEAKLAMATGTRVARMMIGEMNRLDSEIASLHTQLDALSPEDSPERQVLEAQLAMLKAGRQHHIAFVDRLGPVAIARLAGAHIETVDEMGPDFANTAREIRMKEVESAFRVGEFYEASHLVYKCILDAKRLAWTPAQMSELLAWRDRIDEYLRQTLPAGAELPDWSRFDYDRVLKPFLDQIGVAGMEELRKRTQNLR